MDYKQKYLKYKTKYLNLKNLEGGTHERPDDSFKFISNLNLEEYKFSATKYYVVSFSPNEKSDDVPEKLVVVTIDKNTMKYGTIKLFLTNNKYFLEFLDSSILEKKFA